MKILKSEFARNVLTLMTGNTIALAIPLLISPVLTRLYTPDDFGIFALYASLAAVLAVLATGRYEAAILLPEKEENAYTLTGISLLLCMATGLLTLLIILAFNESIAQWLRNPAISPWLYFLPLSMLLLGAFNTLNSWCNRQKEYRSIATAKVFQSSVTSAGQLGFGAANSGGGGLILSAIAGQFAAVSVLMNGFRKNWQEFKKHLSIEELKVMAIRYREFPTYSVAGAVINSLAYNLTYILISVLFSSTVLGFYALVYRVLATPSAVFGNAVSQVYFEQASREKRKSGNSENSFKTTLKRLVMLGIPVFLLLFLVVRYLFSFIFGEEWATAGIYAQILLPFFLVRFISASLSVTMTVFEKLKQALVVHSAIIFATLIIFLLSYWQQWDFRFFLSVYSIVLSGLYAVFLFYYYRLSQGDEKT